MRRAAATVVALAASATVMGSLLSGSTRAASSACPSPLSSSRDPANPLALASPPGPNPLNGAHFFVPGPAHGAAAGAIAQLLRVDPRSYPDAYTWSEFRYDLDYGRFHARIAADPGLAFKVHMLEKIASEPEAQRFSAFSQGGTPSGVYHQAIKIYCHNLTADPGSIPIVNTYFLHPALHACPTPAQMRAAGPLFRARVDAVAAATGSRPVVFLLELDAVGSSRCVQKMGSLPLWEADLRYEAQKLGSLPHTVVYLEAGYSDANGPRYTARVLNASGIRAIRGFYTNDTHLNWTIDEVRWGDEVSRLTHGAHFIVNTAQNGNGPKRNPHPVTQGNEDTCNPPGRALGPPPTTGTGFPRVDAFLWTSPPGNSGGSCRGGPPAGTFWAARAIGLAARADDRLGPTFPSRDY